MDQDELDKKSRDYDVNNGLYRNPKRLVEEMNDILATMNPMKREFCHAMQTAESAKAAAIAAGYSPNSASSKGSQLLSEPAVQRYIGLLGLLRAQVTALDAREVVSMQLSLYYRCVEEGDLKEANKALDQIARMTGAYGGTDSRTKMNPKEIGGLSKEDKEDAADDMLALLQVVENRVEN